MIINLLISIIVPLLFFFAIEAFQRGIGNTLRFIKDSPITALLNYLILLIFTVPAVFFRSAHFAAVLLGMPWLVLAFVSRQLTKFRGVPFVWSDFYSSGEGGAIAGQYLSKTLLINTALGTVGFVFILTIFFLVKFRSYPISCSMRIITAIALAGVTAVGIMYSANHKETKKIEWNIAQSYEKNGFVYSFTASWIDTFRKPVKGYSSKAINTIIDTISAEKEAHNVQRDEKTKGERPNIIMVQTEAFFDPKVIKEAQFNEDPIPHFRRYYNDGWSGHLQVPTLGGGTIRTEFEVLSGINMDLLAPGEAPYNSGLTSKEPIETIAYILGEQGYKATAIHNFQGNFYSRDKAFRNLGFNRFISMENMVNLVKHRVFPEDHVLLDYIKQTMDTTKERNFIFTITAGTHGPYSTTSNEDNAKYVSGLFETSALHQLQNYTSLVKQTDQFIGELAEYVYALEEPTLLIVYSDHYPKLGAIDGLTEKEKYETPYFIIDNQNKLPKKKENNIEAYQLAADVLNLARLEGGIFTDFHNIYRNKKDYRNALALLQYDMLFGKKYAVEGKNPYSKTKLQMGIEPLEIKEAFYQDGGLRIKGTGFTESSKIFLENKPVQTEFINENELIGKILKENEQVSVQVKLLGRADVSVSDSNIYRLNR